MKVLFLQHGLGYGGATKSLLLMQQALKDNIESYTVLSRTKKINQAIKQEFIYSKEFVPFDIPLIYSYSERTIGLQEFEKYRMFFPDELIKYINEKKIDILHVNSTLFSHILRHIKKNTTCKIVVHLREMLPFGNLNPVDAFIIENYTKYADAIISISDNETKFFPQLKKIVVIPNPHDFNATNLFVSASNIKKDTIVIGMCANFLPIKGHINFLDAAQLINEQIDKTSIKIEFRIIGYPQKGKFLKEFVKKVLSYGYKYKFDKKVKQIKIRNLKIIPYTFDIYEELANFDIYVRTDLSGHPWGRDIIEAMAMKKPVVATGASEFFVKDGKTGYLVPTNNSEKMAEKIIELINNPAKGQQMGNEGFLIIKDMCDIESYGNKILNIYESIKK